MTRKTAECYTALFNFIENEVFNLEPSEFMTDFEGGMRKAIETIYPNAAMHTCWFHFKRAIHRNCAKLGMKKLLRDNSDARTIQRQITNLPLLPDASIEDGYFVVKELTRKMGLSSKFKRFFRYFETHWLKEV